MFVKFWISNINCRESCPWARILNPLIWLGSYSILGKAEKTKPQKNINNFFTSLSWSIWQQTVPLVLSAVLKYLRPFFFPYDLKVHSVTDCHKSHKQKYLLSQLTTKKFSMVKTIFQTLTMPWPDCVSVLFQLSCNKFRNLTIRYTIQNIWLSNEMSS